GSNVAMRSTWRARSRWPLRRPKKARSRDAAWSSWPDIAIRYGWSHRVRGALHESELRGKRIIQNLPARPRISVACRHPVWFGLRRLRVRLSGFGLPGSRQLVVAVAETLQAQRETDAFLRGLKDEERRGLPGAQLADKRVVHDDLGIAAARQTAHEARP